MQVVQRKKTRLCATKSIVTVNGKFPGPTVYAREDDRLVVKVVNHVQENVTIHWYDLNFPSEFSSYFIHFGTFFICKRRTNTK